MQEMTNAAAFFVDRGGGEEGVAWWQEGHLLKKQNSFDDFASCAQYLHSAGYSSPAKLTIQACAAGSRFVVHAWSLFVGKGLLTMIWESSTMHASLGEPGQILNTCVFLHAGRLERRPAHGGADHPGETGEPSPGSCPCK